MSWILGHPHTKTVIITDVLLVTRKHMAATPKGPYKQGKLQTNPRCCFYCPTMLHPLLGGESVGLFNDAPSLLLTDSKKIPALLHHQDWVHSPLYNAKGKFYNSCTNENSK